MRMYRLGEAGAPGAWPFLSARHAYLADGTPLTECDEYGRIVTARRARNSIAKVCSDGHLSLAEREQGIDALARALDRCDLIRAPILLLQLQIDPAPVLSKFNQFHKPPGPGGGQFASGPFGDSDTHFQNNPLQVDHVDPVAQSMRVGLNSTYVRGVNPPDIDIAHDLVMNVVRKSILDVGSLNFRPGMPGYGLELHEAIAAEIRALGDPAFQANPLYLDKELLDSAPIPKGTSIPDIVYAPAGVPRIIFEIKTGRAIDTSDTANAQQRERALENIKGNPLYEYIQVYEQ